MTEIVPALALGVVGVVGEGAAAGGAKSKAEVVHDGLRGRLDLCCGSPKHLRGFETILVPRERVVGVPLPRNPNDPAARDDDCSTSQACSGRDPCSPRRLALHAATSLLQSVGAAGLSPVPPLVYEGCPTPSPRDCPSRKRCPAFGAPSGMLVPAESPRNLPTTATTPCKARGRRGRRSPCVAE